MDRSASWLRFALSALILCLADCGGGGGGSPPIVVPPLPPPPPPPPPPGLNPQYRASAQSPFTANCDGAPVSGTLFVNAEVEPYIALNPADASTLVGVWQQDRWSSGSARGVMAATSLDGGQTWTRRPIPFSRCSGGNAGNGGDYARVSNPWVTYSANGTVHAVGLANSGSVFQAGSSNAILASRSLDNGRTWSNPIALIRDGAGFFNDKDAITADPGNANLVYAVWDRLVAGDNGGPTYFARSTNNGVSWEPAKSIYDPGPNSQTISNVLVVLPDGTLVTMFVQIDFLPTQHAKLAVVRSLDKGVTWSAPTRIADLLSVGTRDPFTGAAVRDASIIPQIAVAPNGALHVVWQDGRFNGGAYDAIAIAHSIDGGVTWTAPTRVSAAAGVAAFDPVVHVRSDGVIGVTYYDFRSDTTAAPLMTDYWLARSSDGGLTWSENRVSEAFDLTTAPLTNAPGTGGYFLGDYQSLISRNGVFVPFYAKANSGDLANRTDIFAAPAIASVNAARAKTAWARMAEVSSRRAPRRFHANARIERLVSGNLRRSLSYRATTPDSFDH
ncbi:MAG: sialidase family protein [Luteimonas sp.]